MSEAMTKEIKHQICGDGFIQYHPVKTPAQPDMWESILGAVARGWCYEENANKTMDSELAVAIAKEVQAIYTNPPQRKPLTDEQIEAMWPLRPTDSVIQFARAIEAAHGIKE